MLAGGAIFALDAVAADTMTAAVAAVAATSRNVRISTSFVVGTAKYEDACARAPRYSTPRYALRTSSFC